MCDTCAHDNGALQRFTDASGSQYCSWFCATVDWEERNDAAAPAEIPDEWLIVRDGHRAVTPDEAEALLRRWPWIDRRVVTPERLAQGMTVEREHGAAWNQFTNVGGDCDEVAAKIALAHLAEYPDYYDGLERMEHELAEKWAGRRIPSIFRTHNDA